MTPDPNHIPRGRFGLLMLPITLLAAAVAVGVALGLGGSSREAGLVVLALAVGSVASLGPLLLRLERESWGVGVLACGLARSLLVLGTAYLIETNTPGVEKRPLYLGAMVGAVAILAAETAVAVMILQGIEDARAKLKNAKGGPGARVEHA